MLATHTLKMPSSAFDQLVLILKKFMMFSFKMDSIVLSYITVVIQQSWLKMGAKSLNKMNKTPDIWK